MRLGMPVGAWIAGGIEVPGFTSVDHSDSTSPPATSTTAISVTRSQAGCAPVVSTSTIASGASSNGFISRGGAAVDIRPVGRTLPQNLRQLPDREAEDRQPRDVVDGAEQRGPDAAPPPPAPRGKHQPPRG